MLLHGEGIFGCQRYDAIDATSFMKQKKAVRVLAFSLAKIICHELAHAFRFARFDPSRISGVAFEHRYMTEDGFEWESSVFGGQLDIYEEQLVG